MIFIELVTDAFQGQVQKIGQGVTARTAGKDNVRRPLRGVEINEDTYAFMKLIRSNGVEIPLFDSGSVDGFTTEYSNFILRAVSDQRMEKQQIVETFGETYLFLFGEAPRFLQINAAVLDTLDFPWLDEFSINYAKYLRGTKAIEQGARTYLFYNNNIFEGYILNCVYNISSEPVPAVVDMQFQFFVTNHSILTFVGDGKYPLKASAIFPEGISATDTPTQEQLQQFGTQGNGFQAVRTQPLRSRVIDNTDEYTSPRVNKKTPDEDPTRTRLENITNVNDTVSQIGEAYGANPTAMQAPKTAEELGYAPSFIPAGVGVGSLSGGAPTGGATFGPNANNLSTPGGFSGIKLPTQNNAFSDSYRSTGVSARSGAFQGLTLGSNLGSGAFQDEAEGTVLTLAGSGVGATNPISNVLSKRGVKPNSAAFAKSGLYQKTFANQSMRKAALAGGYAGSGAFLGTQGGSFAGASNANSPGAGATLDVGGIITAFACTVVSGTLQNVAIPIEILVSL